MTTNVQFAVGDPVRWSASGPRGTIVSVTPLDDIRGLDRHKWIGYVGVNFGRIPPIASDLVWLRPEVLLPVSGIEQLAELGQGAS